VSALSACVVSSTSKRSAGSQANVGCRGKVAQATTASSATLVQCVLGEIIERILGLGIAEHLALHVALDEERVAQSDTQVRAQTPRDREPALHINLHR